MNDLEEHSVATALERKEKPAETETMVSMIFFLL